MFEVLPVHPEDAIVFVANLMLACLNSFWVSIPRGVIISPLAGPPGTLIYIYRAAIRCQGTRSSCEDFLREGAEGPHPFL